MKQVKCVITDDEPTACEGLQRYVEKVDFLSLMGVCEDTMQLNTLLQTEQPDLLFLDIEMPYLSGHSKDRGLNSWHLLPIRLM